MVFFKKGVLKNLAKFTGKHSFLSLIFNKAVGSRPATLLKKRLCHRSNFVEFCGIFNNNNTFFTEHLRVTASVLSRKSGIRDYSFFSKVADL